MSDFKSIYKTVGGNEGGKCFYPTRLDMYGCGCQHDCKYCYAKSLLEFRGLWNPQEPAVADVRKVWRRIKRLKRGTVVRLGGMTDCFQPCERQYGLTLDTIKLLNRRGIEYLIVTKSDLIAEDAYISKLDKNLAHIQITITCTDDDLYRRLDYEQAPLPSQRMQAVKRLYENGFDVAVRLSPFIPEFVDYEKLAGIECDKIIVEFLRVNTWVRKWFDIDYTPYTLTQGGYSHMPLKRKLELIQNIKGFREISVCEDEDSAYKYWQTSFNPNPNDCCNLRREV